MMVNKRRSSGRLSSQVRTEATDWLIRFSEGEVDAAAREDFSHWLRTSPEHVRAYLRISALWEDADRIAGPESRRDIDELVRGAQQEANIVPLGVRRGEVDRGKPVRTAKRTPWALAAAVLLAVGMAGTVWYTRHHAPSYATGTGEQRTVNLPDGSTVLINARSRIRVDFSETERAIDLREGQAFFKVARNPARPFIVRSGVARLRAVGTQFDVYRKEGGTVVTVVEGRVAARDSTSTEVLVAAGEQAVLSLHSARKRPVAHVEAATAWTAGLLVFDGTPLSEVIHEFNRQNVKPLVISGPELAELRISGTFPSSGAERIVRFLQERFHVTVVESDAEIRISSPQGTPVTN
jgi:transmembrane sensor